GVQTCALPISDVRLLCSPERSASASPTGSLILVAAPTSTSAAQEHPRRAHAAPTTRRCVAGQTQTQQCRQHPDGRALQQPAEPCGRQALNTDHAVVDQQGIGDIVPNTLFIDGQWVSAVNGETRKIHNPADGSFLAEVDEASPADTELAIA